MRDLLFAVYAGKDHLLLKIIALLQGRIHSLMFLCIDTIVLLLVSFPMLTKG